MTIQSISAIAAELQIAFPSLSQREIADLTLEERKNAHMRTPAVVAATPIAPAAPTVAEIVEKMRKKYREKETLRIRANIQPDGSINIKDTTTYRTYDTHWKRLVEVHGAKSITELDQEMIETFARAAQKSAIATHKAANIVRVAKGLTAREFTGGRSFNLALDSVSVIMAYAVSKKYIPENSTHKVARAKKAAGKRRALTFAQVEEVMQVALNGGNDPILDYLLLWTLLETAGRRGGLIRLQCGDIKEENGQHYLHLHEKGDSDRLQPITQTLYDALLSLAQSRGSTRPTDPVFRYHPNSQGHAAPLTMKRFETLWRRIRSELPWAEEKGVSSHWLRHTTITWIDRAFNPTVAQAFAGHAPATMTAEYSIPTDELLAQAHAALTGTATLQP